MDGVVHVFDGLLDLELLGVKLVFELIDGGFEFGDRLDKELKLQREKMYLPFRRGQLARRHP